MRYYPTTPGNYAIHVTCGDEDIPKSPFTSPAGDAKKVYAEGPGLQPEGVVAGKALFSQSEKFSECNENSPLLCSSCGRRCSLLY